MSEYVFDIETDGFNPTKIHVLSYMDGGEVKSLTDYGDMRGFLSSADTLIGHNIVRYDIPVLQRLLGVTVQSRLVDTLGLSWYLNHTRLKHGLEGYGEDYGVPKPKVDDWDNLTVEEYTHRCEEDVKINTKLWETLRGKLDMLYFRDDSNKERLIDYLTFKLSCAAQQEALRWKLDVAKAEAHRDKLEEELATKKAELVKVMPKRHIYVTKTKPKRTHKDDGSLSVRGQNWFQLLSDLGMPETTTSVRVLDRMEDGNPMSHMQVKDWLYELGWVPCTYNYERNKKTGEVKRIEQVRKDGELSNSVVALSEDHPELLIFEGMTVAQHRLGFLKSLIEAERGGYVVAAIHGLTNTLRFKHVKPLVNLPGVDKPWGKEIRECLIAGEGEVLCGADMVSLEDTTKRHYMQPFDPDYVEEMSKEGFDPHLDLAKFAGVINNEDIANHFNGTQDLSKLRKKYKAANYSCVYGVGAETLSRSTGLTVKEASKLIKAYWERNHAVEKAVSKVEVRKLGDDMWVKNPVSKFWYNLRYEKDKWSTINQSTGVFCFDSWVKLCRERGLEMIGQFHDEVICRVAKGEEEETKSKMKDAISVLNQQLKLNVPLDIDAQFGENYAKIH